MMKDEKRNRLIKKIKKFSDILFIISALCVIVLLYGYFSGMEKDKVTFLVFPLLIFGSLLLAVHEGLLAVVTGKITVNIFQEVSDQPLISMLIGFFYLAIGLLGFLIGVVLFLVLYVIPYFGG